MIRSSKNNTTVWRSSFAAAAGLILLVLALSACSTKESADARETYTCPMHPTVVSDRPGTCPVCGMDLVRRARPGEEAAITEDLSRLIKSPNEIVVATVRTVKGEYKAVPVTARAQGIVTYDTRNIYTIPARVGGRLERVYVKHAFQQVAAGQKVAGIYSPELLTAQRELLFLLENDPQNELLINGAKRKLSLQGMSDGEISVLARTREASSTIGVYSPYSGYIITGQQAPSTGDVKPATQPVDGAMAGDMGPSSSPSAPARSNVSAPGSLVREGDYVTAGQTLFTVVNKKALRVELNLPGSYTGSVKQGSKVKLELGDNDTRTGTVDFIQPFFSEGQNFLMIRVYTGKTENLQIGQLASATIHLDAAEALWVPRETVLALGLQRIVFVKERGVFKPKEVTTGMSADGMIEIRSGLASSDEIAANAHYLVDSESFIEPGM